MTSKINNIWIIQNSNVYSDIISKYQVSFQVNQEKELEQFKKENENKIIKQVNKINKINLLV